MDTTEVLGRAYHPRVLDVALRDALQTAGAVVIEGPRACGKTMTAVNACASSVFLDDPDVAELARVAPNAVLDGPRPRLLDEWQVDPSLWNRVRRAVDRSDSPGAFVLTGSSVPADDATRHSGAGRFLRLRQYTMTLAERGHSTQAVSLSSLFDGTTVRASSEHAYLENAVAWVTGTGFPALAELHADRARTMLGAYTREVASTDLHRVASVAHPPVVVERLLRSIARSVSSDVSYRTLAADLQPVASSIAPETVADYVGHLRRLFAVEVQPAWAPSLRSRARLRTANRLHLAEPALAASLLKATPTALARDPSTLGLLFESLVFHDFAAMLGALGGEVFHYRDSNGYEIDVVAVLPDGRWGAVEVKLGAGQVAAGATSLNKALAQIDTAVVGEPAFRSVITALGSTLTLDDGTTTFPLNALTL